MISESEKPLTSEEIAASVGTNASYIRKIIGFLKKKDIVESRRGVGGFSLKPEAEELCAEAEQFLRKMRDVCKNLSCSGD